MSEAVATATQRFEEGLDRRRLAVVSAQATSLRWQILATALVVSLLVWRFVPATVVLAWLVLVIVVREWRAHALRRLAEDVDRPMPSKLRQAFAWNAALGVTNGSAAVFMAWLDQTFDALLTMVLMSWAAGAVSTSGPLLRAYLVFSACLIAPTAVMWMVNWTPVSVAVAALILMFAGVQYRFAKQNAQVFEESYRIRVENESLVLQLSQARDAAEAANRAKSRFLAAASHDLRQPLHALTLHGGLLQQEPLPDDAPAIAREIAGSIDSLAKLLDSLLDISKLDAGVVVVERRPIRLERLVANLVRTHLPRAREKGLVLRLECPRDAVVLTDPLLLERLLGNLIDNAVKYTERGQVCVEVLASAAAFDIAVRDTGCGIPADAHDKIFEEFYQVDQAVPGTEHGLGLGLAIVARLSLLLDLKLVFESQVGQGTTFGLSVPRASAVRSEPASELASDDRLQGVKVLFIDDEDAVRRALRNVLARFGCEAVAASSSDEALAQVRDFTPQLVLADYRLADGDSGIDAIARLRQQLPGLPALLISGDTDAERLREAERSGLQLLHKPVTLSRLREAMQRVLDNKPSASATGD